MSEISNANIRRIAEMLSALPEGEREATCLHLLGVINGVALASDVKADAALRDYAAHGVQEKASESA